MPSTFSPEDLLGLPGQSNGDRIIQHIKFLTHTEGTVKECRQMLLCQASFYPRQVTLLFIQKPDASTVVRARRITLFFFFL